MRTRLAGLFGHPIQHSLSPALHNIWFTSYGIDAEYLLWDVKDEQSLAAKFSELKSSERFLGCNITIPHKANALGLSSIHNPHARKAKAANTLFYRNGVWVADNTDVDGLKATLETLVPANVNFHTIIFGNGATTRSLLCALDDDSRAMQTAVLSRSALNSQVWDGVFKKNPTLVHYSEFDATLEKISSQHVLVVNTVPAQSESVQDANFLNSLILKVKAASQKTWFLDVSYFDTPRMAFCKKHNVDSTNGLHMLKVQAQKSFFLWTGVLPSLELVKNIK